MRELVETIAASVKPSDPDSKIIPGLFFLANLNKKVELFTAIIFICIQIDIFNSCVFFIDVLSWASTRQINDISNQTYFKI